MPFLGFANRGNVENSMLNFSDKEFDSMYCYEASCEGCEDKDCQHHCINEIEEDLNGE